MEHVAYWTPLDTNALRENIEGEVSMTVQEVIEKIAIAKEKIDQENDSDNPDYELIDILENYIQILSNFKIAK